MENHYTEEQEILHSKRGEYVPWPILLEKEGVLIDPLSLKHALIYAIKCTIWGGMWTRWNDISEWG